MSSNDKRQILVVVMATVAPIGVFFADQAINPVVRRIRRMTSNFNNITQLGGE